MAATSLLCIALIIAVVVAILVVISAEQQQRVNPPTWLSHRYVMSVSTREVVAQSSRKRRSVGDSIDNNFSTSSPNITMNSEWNSSSNGNSSDLELMTTTIVLSSSSTDVLILIVHGNVSITNLDDSSTTTPDPRGARRRRRDTTGSNINSLQDVPMLLVSADPFTGNITSFKGTGNCSDQFKSVGLIVARSMLTNQDTSAYTSQNNNSSRKRRNTDSTGCSYVENIGNSVFCTEFLKQTSPTREVYKKVYSSGSGLFRDASSSPNIDVSIEFETHVDNDKQTLVFSQVTGAATMNAIETSGKSAQQKQLTLQRSTQTNFTADNSSLSDGAIDKLHEMVLSLDFQEVDLKSTSAVNSPFISGNSTARGNSSQTPQVKRKRRDSDSPQAVNIATIFGAKVDFIVDLITRSDSATASLNLRISTFEFAVAQKDLGESVAHSINQILNLRSFVKKLLDNTLTSVDSFINSVKTDFLNKIDNRLATIKLHAANLKTAFNYPIGQVAIELQNYKTKVYAIRNASLLKLQSLIDAGNAQIIQIQQQEAAAIAEKNLTISRQISTYEQQYNSAVAALLTIQSILNSTQNKSLDKNLTSQKELWQSIKMNASNAIIKLQLDFKTFVALQQQNAQGLIAQAQNPITALKAKVEAILNGNYSFAQDLKDAGLTTIDNIFASFTKAESDISSILQSIQGEGQILFNELKSGLETFKTELLSTSSQVLASVQNVASQATTSNTDEGNIFDWAFMRNGISSIKSSFTTISDGMGGARDHLAKEISSLWSDLNSAIDPTAWAQIYMDAMGLISQCKSALLYQIDPPKLSQSSVQSSASSISSSSQQQLSNVTLESLISSASSPTLLLTIAELVSADLLREAVINKFLGELEIPIKTVHLYSPAIPPFILYQYPTPIGLIGIGGSVILTVDLDIGIVLSPEKFAAVLTPNAQVWIGAGGFWYGAIAQVGATVGVTVLVTY